MHHLYGTVKPHGICDTGGIASRCHRAPPLFAAALWADQASGSHRKFQTLFPMRPSVHTPAQPAESKAASHPWPTDVWSKDSNMIGLSQSPEGRSRRSLSSSQRDGDGSAALQSSVARSACCAVVMLYCCTSAHAQVAPQVVVDSKCTAAHTTVSSRLVLG